MQLDWFQAGCCVTLPSGVTLPRPPQHSARRRMSSCMPGRIPRHAAYPACRLACPLADTNISSMQVTCANTGSTYRKVGSMHVKAADICRLAVCTFRLPTYVGSHASKPAIIRSVYIIAACTLLQRVHYCSMYIIAACTLLQMYIIAACTLLQHVHYCSMYIIAACTLLQHVHQGSVFTD